MRRQRSGVLVHISSGAGCVIAPSMGFYCASKFALEALAESYSYELAGQGIESVIVEPGPYETPVFGKTAMAADGIRTTTYGAVKEIPAKIKAALLSMAGNPQEVADAVLRIVETPEGEKQLRYLVRPASLGIEQINTLSNQVQAKLLEAFDLAADTRFVKGIAVGSV
jgi:NAD(P)-dependent dehydrogenase (short-subunit alcohol dehydrogenase family)